MGGMRDYFGAGCWKPSLLLKYLMEGWARFQGDKEGIWPPSRARETARDAGVALLEPGRVGVAPGDNHSL